jgi:pimeloyl-ACP methyl ester carboxylesterase
MNSSTFNQAVLALVGLALPGCATISHGEYTSHWNPSERTKTIQLSNGFTLRYLQVGSGHPLVFLHTIRTQLDYFEKVVPAVRKHYKVYLLDLPGHGQSSIQPVEYTEEVFRKSVAEFIEKLNLHDVTLVGESIGGVLALTLAATVPDRVSRIVAINPYDYGESFGGGIRRSRNGWIVALFNVFGAYTPEFRFLLSAVMRGGFHDPARLPETLLTEFHRAGRRAGYRRVEYSVFKNWRTWVAARRFYPQIEIPVTLVYSQHDWSRPEERERNEAALKHAKLVTISDAGHFLSLESPADTIRVIRSQDAHEGL